MAPARVPGSSGSRNLPDNLSDLRAQVAANQKVIYLFVYSLFNIFHHVLNTFLLKVISASIYGKKINN